MNQFTRTGQNSIYQPNPISNSNNIGRVIFTDKNGKVSYEIYSPNSNSLKLGTDLNTLPTAKPLNPGEQHYPLPGELIYITSGPSPKSVTNETSITNYYTSIINIWNNIHNNAQFSNEEPPYKQYDINKLQYFEGDKIINGRFGNNIRFGNTNPEHSNFWNTGTEGKPIFILSNDVNKDLENIEEDNLIIMSSTQKIPLKTFTSTSNKITQTILPKDSSFKSQFLNAERIVLNTLKDDILLYSNKNIELYSNNNISLNTKRLLIDSEKICLGQNGKEEPTEPALLGNKTEDLIRDLLKALTTFSNTLSSTVSTPAGTPLVTVATAASTLINNLQKSISKLEKIKSKTVYLK